MLITESKFYHHVPAATNPEGSGVFDMVNTDIKNALDSLKAFAGETLYAKLSAAQDDDFDDLYYLAGWAEEYVCLLAFETAIPSLDIVLTPTGFGVVSNANVAPASADRVAKLVRSVRDKKETAFDKLLDGLRGNPDWCESDQAKDYFSSVIWSGEQMRYFGFPGEGRTKLDELRGEISAAEDVIKVLVSPEFFDDVTAAIRTAAPGTMKQKAATLFRGFICSYVDRDKYHCVSFKNIILSFLEDNLYYFPIYAESAAFRANHFKNYENDQKDSCYFFG